VWNNVFRRQARRAVSSNPVLSRLVGGQGFTLQRQNTLARFAGANAFRKESGT
jgi:hypothetical protein